MAFRDETKIDALAALAANGGNVLKTARELGIAEATLRSWKRLAEGGALAGSVAERQTELAERLEELACLCLSVLPAKLAHADAKTVAVTLGITMDKAAALRTATADRPDPGLYCTPEETLAALERLVNGAPPEERST